MTEEVKLSDKVQKIIDAIKELNAMDLSELKKGIESTFGVTAATGGGMMMAAPVAEAGPAADAAPTKFDVILMTAADRKIPVIKVVKEILGIDLAAAKKLVDSAPKAVKENVSKDEAEKLKKQLEDAGATIDVKGK